jgi:hypothetical protein
MRRATVEELHEPLGHASGAMKKAGSRGRELNPRPTDYEGQEALSSNFFAVADLREILSTGGLRSRTSTTRCDHGRQATTRIS